MTTSELRPIRRSAYLGDKTITVAATFLAALYMYMAWESPSVSSMAEAAISLVFLPFFWFWRSRPMWSAVGFSACLAAWCIIWMAHLPGNLGVTPWLLTAPMAVYATARYCQDRRFPRVMLALMFAGSFLSPVMWRLLDNLELKYVTALDATWRIAAHWSLLAAAYFAGARYFSKELQRAAQEQERLGRLQRAKEEERLLIARELHDVLAHSLTLMKVQAQAGLIAAKSDKNAAVEALNIIRETSDTALSDVRAIVSALRNEETVVLPASQQLEDLSEIIAAFTTAGLEINATLPQAISDVPALVQLAATRIVTESLTNALRHQGAKTKVELNMACDKAVRIKIDSWGSLQEKRGPGAQVGLIGLAERARSLGGDFQASGTPEAFHVSATIPI